MESILDSIKQLLGVSPEDLNFDKELIMYINGALMIMNQLGVGTRGYRIIDKNNTWNEFLLDRDDLALVIPDVHLRVKLDFDPPANSFLVASMESQIQEYDWRIEWNHNPEV